jgi:signal transduction histidine kinase
LLIVVSLISIKKSQQEQIWVGMAKETAHQLGTPITSLIGWLENIKLSYPDNDKLLAIAEEMNKDVIMLDMVAGRFSKIGAKPELSEQNIFENLNRLYEYIKLRAPRKVQLYFPDFSERNILVAKINPLLFDWVIENLLKNALDALEGKGLIKVEVTDSSNWVHIDISDSGKGIPKSLFHKIFKPGFSTKKRGWGLGLSLSGRIIKDYHKGKIFVKNSIVNQGTTFRISLPKK